MDIGEALIGQLVDARYRLLRLLGQGGFGLVYEADHIVSTEALARIALKLVPYRPGGGAHQYTELKHALSLEHPNVVRCHSVGDASVRLNGKTVPVLFVAMELAEGTLAERLEGARLGLSEATDVARDVAAALEYLLARNLSHRDLKPSNVLRVAGRWKLGDLGLATPLENGKTAAAPVAGTWAYQSPEGAEGQVSPAGDCWSLGVLLLEALTGQRPFVAASLGELMYLLRTAHPAIPPGLPEPLGRIVEGCLRRDRATRLTPAGVLEALRTTSQTREPASRAYCVVAPEGGNYDSVVQAVQDAAPWSRVLVKPGTYTGQVVLDKPLELIALGASADVVLDGGNASALVIDTADAMVRGFTLRMTGRQATDAKAVVEVRSGQSMLDLCEVSTSAAACLHVSGRDARPIVRRCRFIGGRHEAVVFREDAEGLMEACQIQSAPRTGLAIRDKANPLIRRCQIQGPQFRGFHAGDKSRGVIEDCHVEGGTGPAIELSRHAQPIVRRVRIVAGADVGVQASSGAKGIFAECTIDAPAGKDWKLANGHQVQRL